MEVVLQVIVEGGKYEVRQYSDGKVLALRNGAPWRDLTGDKLVLALCQEIDSLTIKP